jgi:hypothetical protein
VTKPICFNLIFVVLSLFVNKISQADDCSVITNATTDNDFCVQINVQSKSKHALADMVVYLEPLSGQILPSSTKTLVIKQHNKSFSPYLSVIQSNQVTRFTNQDDITHHIYSVSQGNKFSFKIRAGQSNDEMTFDHSSEIAMGCNIHDWMSGYLLVVDTPYFGKSNKLGAASFNHVKAGKYRVVVWHPQMQAGDNRLIVEKQINKNSVFSVNLTAELEKLPRQESDDDFDFLSDY